MGAWKKESNSMIDPMHASCEDESVSVGCEIQARTDGEMPVRGQNPGWIVTKLIRKRSGLESKTRVDLQVY